MSDTAETPRRRLLFIVSRQRVDLYDSLRKALGNEPGVEVILERRDAAHRSSDTPAGEDRRGRQRRERLSVESEVRECGWAVVKIATWPEADLRRRS